jgi:hypothetical protein
LEADVVVVHKHIFAAGGKLVIACWCQREETPEKPFSEQEKKELQFLYDEWAHPYFISYQEFARHMEVRAHVGPAATQQGQWGCKAPACTSHKLVLCNGPLVCAR